MKYALINTTIASLRKEAKSDSELVDEALYGMKVEIIEKFTDEWYLIRTQYDYTGYVHIFELLMNEEKILIYKKAYKKTVTKAYADVHASPNVRGHVLISLSRGSIISVCKEENENGYVKAIMCDGRVGYIKEEFLSDYIIPDKFEYKLRLQKGEITEEKLREDIVNTAYLYFGTQYRWGGKSTLGIDCSGLCSMAYLINGIIIFRDAKIIEGFPIHKIDLNNIKRADLLCFPGHMAMYIGDGKYIHSTDRKGSSGVVINSLYKECSDYREDLAKSLTAAGSIF